MKYHEEDKLNALLNYLGINEEDADEIMNCIRDKNADSEDLYRIVERTKVML